MLVELALCACVVINEYSRCPCSPAAVAVDADHVRVGHPSLGEFWLIKQQQQQSVGRTHLAIDKHWSE